MKSELSLRDYIIRLGLDFDKSNPVMCQRLRDFLSVNPNNSLPNEKILNYHGIVVLKNQKNKINVLDDPFTNYLKS